MKQTRWKVCFFLMLVMLLAVCGTAYAAQDASQASGEAAASFKDVTSADANAIYINYMAGKDLIKGFPDGGFHPKEGLTRAQAATLLVKTAGLNAAGKKTGQFKDVPADHWAAGYIAAASEAGYLKGYPDGSFLPEKKLSRAEGISLFMRLSKQKSEAALPALKDMDSKHWASGAMATALAAGMIIPGKDGNSIYPDQDFLRGDLARAVAVLLTREPDLSRASLNASLKVKKGDVFLIKSGSGKEDKVTSAVALSAGDTVKTGSNGEAELAFADGSGLLLKSNTILVLKTSQGKNYIKKDGNPGVGVELLEVELKYGKLFGALASTSGTVNTPQPEEKKTSLNMANKLASLKDAALRLFAAADKEQPWYQTAEKKKVKVKVDMPWGVAAIRGSIWSNAVDDNGNSTSLLEGEAEITAGGQTQSLNPGQSSAVTSQGTPPTPPVPMSQQERNEWVQNQDWVQERVQAIETNQALTPQTDTNVVSVTNAVNQALTNIGAGSNTGTSGSSGGSSGSNGSSSENNSSSSSSSSSFSYLPAGAWGLTDVTSVVYQNQSMVLTQDFWVKPPTGVTATKYQLWGKFSTNGWQEIASKGINERTRHLAKVFSEPQNLIINLYNDTSYGYSVGTYFLAENGGQKVLQDVATQTVSGAVYLPAPAGVGGVPLKLWIDGQSTDGYDYYANTVLTVPAGSSSVSYSIKAPRGSNYSLFCNVSCSSSYTGPPYRSTGVNGINLTSGNTDNVNVTMVQGRWITGTVTLPSGVNDPSRYTFILRQHLVICLPLPSYL
ncbi:S-layer homology domain-containing protein [Syntrophomonas palmitatica]|uniref:S-layer homology domain-containing protein n=1 Tax=Syntrophomonas palmitatica TaxID=402877 RepID=UPI0006D15EE0|nr:S-layer homology domain-containing protein [Syntrophomonas palmitatica]